MAKTFNDLFPNGEGFVAKPGRKWRGTMSGSIYVETNATKLTCSGYLLYTKAPNDEARGTLEVSYLELLEEPTDREAIHAAVDAYLDALANCEKTSAVYIDAERATNEALKAEDVARESLKKLLNL